LIAFSQPEAFRTAYCLSKSEPNRMEFVMPRGQYLFIGATALLFGLFILFYPEYFAEYPDFLVPIIGWSGVLIAAALLYAARIQFAERKHGMDKAFFGIFGGSNPAGEKHAQLS